MARLKEYRVYADGDVQDLCEITRALGAEHVHAFYDEPWWPGRWVIRTDGFLPSGWAKRAEYEDYEHDAGLPGFLDMLDAGNRVPTDHARKATHCLLNQWGYTYWGEARFYLRAAMRSLWLAIKGA